MTFFRKFDWFLLLPVIFLLGLGIGTIASVSSANLLNHVIYILVALVFFIILSVIDINIIAPFSPLIYLFGLVLLILPFIFGTVTRGSVRWIPIGGFTLQPSELAKPFYALFSAWYWHSQVSKFTFKKLIIFGLYSLPVLILIFLQPDLGSTLVVLSIAAGSVFFSGIRLKHIAVIGLIIILLVPSSWFLLKDYQKMRLVHFLNPYSDPLGEGYNVIQSRITVGSGSLFGRGFGKGTQSHLSFLPERHTDFIFASLSEEMGFAGSFLVLVLYFVMLYKIFLIGKRQNDRLSTLIVINIFIYLFFQTAVNIGMNVGILPITGVTLPFISYGGSSLLASLISLGLVESVSKNRGKEHVIEIR